MATTVNENEPPQCRNCQLGAEYWSGVPQNISNLLRSLLWCCRFHRTQVYGTVSHRELTQPRPPKETAPAQPLFHRSFASKTDRRLPSECSHRTQNQHK